MGVLDDGSLVVRCPLNTPVSSVEKFLLSKSNWIDRHRAIKSEQNSRLSDVIAHKSVLIQGVSVPLQVGDRNFFGDSLIQVKSIKCLKKLLTDNLGDKFLNLLNSISKSCGLAYSSVCFRDYKSRWGCCDRLKNLKFNYKLLMLPQDIWKYLIVHELCHTAHMDHSKNFYNLVEKIMPDYKSAQRRLKNYSVIVRLY